MSTDTSECKITRTVCAILSKTLNEDPEASEDVFAFLCFRFQSGKKMVYLPLLFVDELSNRVKDLVVSLFIGISVT